MKLLSYFFSSLGSQIDKAAARDSPILHSSSVSPKGAGNADLHKIVLVQEVMFVFWHNREVLRGEPGKEMQLKAEVMSLRAVTDMLFHCNAVCP